jgi:hypothetical protein
MGKKEDARLFLGCSIFLLGFWMFLTRGGQQKKCWGGGSQFLFVFVSIVPVHVAPVAFAASSSQ